MVSSNFFALALVLAVSCAGIATADKCIPEVNCKLPYCRCSLDTASPGNYSLDLTPQMVMLAFSYSLNEVTVDKYLPLFDDLVNPNNCTPKGTFFVQDINTDVKTIKKLYLNGHEIGLTAANGQVPHNRSQWVETLFRSQQKLYKAGIPRGTAKGVRAPMQFLGGDAEMDAMREFGMYYDASCVAPVTTGGKVSWPFTYDFTEGNPRCDVGKTPSNRFPGMWQFTIPDMKVGDHTCSTISGCSPYIKTNRDAFTLLYEAYERHFNSKKAPMVLFIDPQWMTKKHQIIGLRQFLEVIGRFPHTWIVTLNQALQWVKYPVPMYPTVNFMPWDCPKEEKLANSKYLDLIYSKRR